MKVKTFFKSVFAIILLWIMLSFSACDSIKLQEYYSQKENYVNATGTVSYFSYNDDCTSLYLDFSELTPAFDDTCFKIVGNNLLIVKSNGIDEKIQLGDQVDFVTAPKYFGDGYVMPIVAITVDGENLLGFDEGLVNLLIWLEN